MGVGNRRVIKRSWIMRDNVYLCRSGRPHLPDRLKYTCVAGFTFGLVGLRITFPKPKKGAENLIRVFAEPPTRNGSIQLTH